MSPSPKGRADDIVSEIGAQVAGLRSTTLQSFCAQHLHRDISLPQLCILMTVHERGPMTVSELAHLFMTSMSSASSILDRMEERGLVVRVRDGKDRRVVSVEVSERGRDVAEEFVGLKRDHLTRLLEVMTEAELTSLLAGLGALRAALARLNATELKKGEATHDPPWVDEGVSDFSAVGSPTADRPAGAGFPN